MKRTWMVAGLGMFAAALPLWAEIRAGDTIEIILKGVPVGEKAEVDGRYVVGESGTIRLPIADVAVVAAGLTGEQLARRIEAATREAEVCSRPTAFEGEQELDFPPLGRGSPSGGKEKRVTRSSDHVTR